MKKFSIMLLAAVFLVGCQNSGNDDLVKKVADLEAKVAAMNEIQTQIAQKAGLGALVRPDELQFADGHKLGSETAKVAILEFTDLQCPFCGKFNSETWPELKKKYVDSGKVLFVGREFPLHVAHPQAPFAALTLRCAATQNIYQPVKDLMFANQGTLNQEVVDTELKKLNADVAKHAECMKSQDFQLGVRDSAKYARALGLSSTPTFFIGVNTGKGVTEYQEVVGAKSLEEFSSIIDTLLAK